MQGKERISCPDPIIIRRSGSFAFTLSRCENGCRRIANWCPPIGGGAAVVIRGAHGEVNEVLISIRSVE